MADLLCRLERELLEKPYDLAKSAAKGTAFFGAVTVPAVVSDKLNQYGVPVNNTNITQAKDVVNQTVNEYANQATSTAINNVDARYDINSSLHALNNIGDAASRIKMVMDPNGEVNKTFVNNTLIQNRPMIEREIAHYIQYAHDYVIQHYVTQDLVTYAIIGAAAIFLIAFSGGMLGSYFGTRLAMRKYDKRDNK